MTPGGVDRVRFAVRLTPRGGADRIDGVVDGVLRARVAAAPVDGAANRSLLRLVGEELDVPRGAVRLVGGDASRVKLIEVEGLGRASVAARWPGIDV